MINIFYRWKMEKYEYFDIIKNYADEFVGDPLAEFLLDDFPPEDKKLRQSDY